MPSLGPLDPALGMAEVYSLYFPEAQAVLRELRTHPDFDRWFDEAWLGREAQVPAEFLETWRAWSGLSLEGYPHRHVGNGSSEVIREVMGAGAVGVFEGEYEGYAHCARGPVLRAARPAAVAADVYWISEPSALDGEYWDGLEAFVRDAPAEARFVIDVAYHGVTRAPQDIPALRDPRVMAVVFSLSKVFGLYRWRVGGVFSRAPIRGLAYNHFFNSLFGLKAGIELMRRHACGAIPRRYAPEQKALVADLVARGQAPADTEPSNVLLLARSRFPHVDPRCNRAPGFTRICLTPGLHARISR